MLKNKIFYGLFQNKITCINISTWINFIPSVPVFNSNFYNKRDFTFLNLECNYLNNWLLVNINLDTVLPYCFTTC